MPFNLYFCSVDHVEYIYSRAKSQLLKNTKGLNCTEEILKNKQLHKSLMAMTLAGFLDNDSSKVF